MTIGMVKEVLRKTIAIYNPWLNVLISDSGDNNLFAILAENMSLGDEAVYVVAGYRMDNLKPEPDVLFWGIEDLDRAKVVYEELVRTF